MKEKTKEFLDQVFENNPRQKKSIEKTMQEYFTDSDYYQLENIIAFYIQTMSIAEIVEAYNLIVEDTANETKKFLLSGKYSYSSFEETEKLVYSNSEYMSKYMIGLSLSGYLWPNHIKMFHWFQEIIKRYKGDRYLEIGPGHGRYFCEAAKTGKFLRYDAIDISETSVLQTNRFIHEFLDRDKLNRCNVFCQDAFKYDPCCGYDFVVIAEVLEHLEHPEAMLKRIYELSKSDSYIYVTVPVNAPAIDHIYLFHTIDEVKDMIASSGFDILDYINATAGDMELEKAIRKRNAILVGVLAKKVSK